MYVFLIIKKWTEILDGKVYDSSSVVAFKIIETANVKKIYLAGFDGFSLGINDNYYEPEMRVQVLEKQAEERDLFYKNRIHNIKEKGIDVIFVTPSKYAEKSIGAYRFCLYRGFV